MTDDPIPAAPSSGSKRKRESNEYDDNNSYGLRLDRGQAPDPDIHAAKRGRPHIDKEPSEETPYRGLKRKSKAAAPRESRFLEGSFGDKPSRQPPTVFTQMTRTDTGNLKHLDDLMSGYHDGESSPRNSTDTVTVHAKDFTFNRNSDISLQSSRQDENSGFFRRTSRSLAANFHPVALWNKLWNESKEELRQNMEETARKARLKAEAEEKYAQLKNAGNLRFFPAPTTHTRASVGNSTLRDSGIVMESGKTSSDYGALHSPPPPPPPPKDNISIYSESENQDPESRTGKGLKSRLNFMRPSLLNLKKEMKKDLKRAKSDYHLGMSSCSSASPTKAEFDVSPLKKSASKFDIRRQYRLSKRVSDLETKLQQARHELNEALVDASPAPKLNDRYERFTTTSKPANSTFIPGALPTLPSESLLTADRYEPESPGKVKRGKKTFSGKFEGSDDEDTIKALPDQEYPTRASSLFRLYTDNATTPPKEKPAPQQPIGEAAAMEFKAQLPGTMDTPSKTPQTQTKESNPFTGPKPDESTPTPIDVTLDILNSASKSAKKTKQVRKRKPSKDLADRTFAPWTEGDDSDGDVFETPRKRRKSSGKSSKSPGSARSKKSPRVMKKSDANSPLRPEPLFSTNVAPAVQMPQARPDPPQAFPSLSNAPPIDLSRPSLENQQLEPLYEEDEETSIIPIKFDPTGSPARFTNSDAKAQTPKDDPKPNRASAAEEIMTRAGMAARAGRRGRSVSPLPPTPEEPVHVSKAIRLVPGAGGIPELPTGPANKATGVTKNVSKRKNVPVSTASRSANRAAENFEWPDDVF